MKVYKADLHIHSVLSPCGDLEMGPINIIKESLAKNLDIISLTDHNITENCIAMKMAASNKIGFFPGVEVSTMEDIHILLYFQSLTDSLKFQDILFEYISPLKNNPDKFGYQIVVDAGENIIRMEDKLLITTINLPLEELIQIGRQFNSLIVLSHIDADSFSIISQLGFIPDDLDIDAVEIQSVDFENTTDYPAITSSDAHYLKDIGRRYTEFYIKEPTIEEIKLALQKKQSRYYKRVYTNKKKG